MHFFSDGSRHPEVESDVEALCRSRQSRQQLLTFLCKYSAQIEDTIKRLGNLLFLSNFPTIVRWDLVRCTVDTSNSFFKVRPLKVATLEHLDSAAESAEWTFDNEDTYIPCIRIQLPDDIPQEDPRVTRMRDILACDEEGKFRFLPGIPFRGHPVYGLFSIQLTKDVAKKDLTQLDGTIWSLSSGVFLPVPDTIHDRDSTLYLLHDTSKQSGIIMWQREVDKQRERRIMGSVRYVESEDLHSYRGGFFERQVRN
ncbi:hypothetical protein F4818DRAFT_443322 [Hypoxylon cercidicola]|nr:hypothetical protein F4818DRAFT_443322 [Hypoxylon cercidicola]